MNDLARKWFATQMKPLAKARQRFGTLCMDAPARSNNLLEALDHQLLESGAPLCSGDRRALCQSIGQLNGCFYTAIFPARSRTAFVRITAR